MEKAIKAEENGQRLDKYLCAYFPDYSRTWLQKLIKDGNIRVNGTQVFKPHFQLSAGDRIILNVISPPEINLSPDNTINWETIFECGDYLVINKPAGLVVHPAEGIRDRTLVNGLLSRYPEIAKVGDDITRPGIVHRLDREVSGLMLIALNQEAFEYFKNLFKKRAICKYYTALVYGTEIPENGRINFPLTRSKKGKIVSISGKTETTKKIRWAETEYTVIKRYHNYTLIKLSIITGRTHQIRAHLHGLGHPIVGDSVYYIKKYKKLDSTAKLLLCASQLSFIDLGGRQKSFKIQLPEYFNNFLRKLNNH